MAVPAHVKDAHFGRFIINIFVSDLMWNEIKAYCLIFHIPGAIFEGVGVFWELK